jgi:hypothetical protein
MINGLVHPFREKCESANWRWVRANQLAPQGLGPAMNLQNQCSYGMIAPYTNPQVVAQMEAATPFRVWGYPNVTACGKLAPLLYAPRVDSNPTPAAGPQCTCNNAIVNPWPSGYFCGKSCQYRQRN